RRPSGSRVRRGEPVAGQGFRAGACARAGLFHRPRRGGRLVLLTAAATDRPDRMRNPGRSWHAGGMQVIRLVLNILWLILAGFWMAVGYLGAAVICFILIITTPFGIPALRNAAYVLWPFGRTTVDKPGAGAG